MRSHHHLTLRRFWPAALTALLVACGGGGGGGSEPPIVVLGPPTNAATLANSTDDAAQSAKAAAVAADAAATNSNSMTGVFALFGVPTGLRNSPASTREKAMAAQTVGCSDFLDPPCTGSASADTNLAANATTAPAGTFIDINFLSLSGGLYGDSVSLNGHMRLDFMSSFNLTNPAPTGMDLQLSFEAFSGAVNGYAFGPITEVARLQIDSQGNTSVTAGGLRYTGLSGVTVTDASNYTVAGGSVRTSHWTNSNAYVDLSLTQWQVTGGRPAVGSKATLTAGSGSVAITVTSSSASTVVYAATLTLGANSTGYVVTASYPNGSGAPTYTAALAG